MNIQKLVSFVKQLHNLVIKCTVHFMYLAFVSLFLKITVTESSIVLRIEC